MYEQRTNNTQTPHQAIAYYRRRNAASPDEKECVENLYDALCSSLLVPENQARFRQSEGVDLLLRCLREKKGGFLGAVKALDSALLNSVPNCEKLVELGGLKAVFPLFMGRGWGGALKGKRQGERDALTEQVASIVASLCMLLMQVPGGGGEGGSSKRAAAREMCEARLLGKFVEGEGEKVDRAVELFVNYDAKVCKGGGMRWVCVGVWEDGWMLVRCGWKGGFALHWLSLFPRRNDLHCTDRHPTNRWPRRGRGRRRRRRLWRRKG